MQMCGALNNYYEGAEYSNELLVINSDDCYYVKQLISVVLNGWYIKLLIVNDC